MQPSIRKLKLCTFEDIPENNPVMYKSEYESLEHVRYVIGKPRTHKIHSEAILSDIFKYLNYIKWFLSIFSGKNSYFLRCSFLRFLEILDLRRFHFQSRWTSNINVERIIDTLQRIFSKTVGQHQFCWPNYHVENQTIILL